MVRNWISKKSVMIISFDLKKKTWVIVIAHSLHNKPSFINPLAEFGKE